MQIKNFTNGSIPFLVNYEPFVLEANKQTCQSIDDMIEYDENITTQTFDYELGTNETFNFTFPIKNITDNATITIESNYEENVFLQTDEIILAPGEGKNITVTSNSEYLNTITSVENILFILKFTVTNIMNGQLITKTV